MRVWLGFSKTLEGVVLLDLWTCGLVGFGVFCASLLLGFQCFVLLVYSCISMHCSHCLHLQFSILSAPLWLNDQDYCLLSLQ